MKKYKINGIYKHILVNRIKYILISLCILIGVVLGSISGVKTSDNDINIDNFISLYKLQGILNREVFVNSVLINIRYIICFFISGLYIWLIPLGLVTLVSKGYSIGYAIVFFIKECGASGFAFTCVTMLISNLITIPLSVTYMVYQFNYVNKISKLKKNSGNYRQLKKISLNNIIIFLAAILIALLCSLFDASITPAIINLFYGNIA